MQYLISDMNFAFVMSAFVFLPALIVILLFVAYLVAMRYGWRPWEQ